MELTKENRAAPGKYNTPIGVKSIFIHFVFLILKYVH